MEALELISSWLFVCHFSSQILKLLRGEGDELNYSTKRKFEISKDIDEVVEDEYAENSGSCDIQTHLTLAMLGVDDDVVSNSTPGQSLSFTCEKNLGILFVWALQPFSQLYLYGHYKKVVNSATYVVV